MKISQRFFSAVLTVLALTISLGSTGIAQHASAETSAWPTEKLVGNKNISLEVQATQYDSTKNAFQYRIAWAVPKGKTYSLVLDGKLAQKRITKQSGYYTDFTFAPTTSHTIAVYPNTTGKGKALFSGKFTVPEASPTNINEDALLKGYIDTYPALPTTQVAAPDDAAQIIQLAKQINDLEKFEDVYPYLNSKSLEMLNRVPSLKEYTQGTGGAFLGGMSEVNSKVTVFEGKTVALYTSTEKQVISNYSRTVYYVFVKENGQWKYDFLGSVKQEIDSDRQKNPTGSYVIGNSTTDIGIAEIDFTTDHPMVTDPGTQGVVLLKNMGNTAIEKFDVNVKFGQLQIMYDTITAEVLPGQQILVVLPLTRYWNRVNAQKNPGSFTLEVAVSVDPANLDTYQSNNSKSATATFEAYTPATFPSSSLTQ